MDNIYKRYIPPSGNGGQYLKFEDAQPIRLRIVSEPVVFDSIFKQGTKDQVSTRYAWIVWNYDEEKPQVMVLPTTAYRMVADLGADDDWGDPVDAPYNLKITRRGTGLETRFTVNPSVAKEELNEDKQNQIKGINLIKAIESSPSSSRVEYLRDVISNGDRTTSTKKQDQDVVIDDIDDEPINLDDIPF